MFSFTHTLCFLPSLSLSPSSGRVVFHVPDWLHHLLMAGRILLKNTLEAYADHYLQKKLNQVVQEHRLVSLITLLRGKMWRRKSPARALTRRPDECDRLPSQTRCSVRAVCPARPKTSRGGPRRPLRR